MRTLPFQLLLCILFITSCKKDRNESPDVEINGNTYATTKIGNRVWMASNYNGGLAAGLYYNDAVADNEGGKLYTLYEAKIIPVPAGWRLPDYADFEDLIRNTGVVTKQFNSLSIDAQDTQKLRSFNGWTFSHGSNSNGFNAYPAGRAYRQDTFHTNYEARGEATTFWSSTPYSYLQYVFTIAPVNSNGPVASIETADPEGQRRLYSIRFVRDL